MIYFNFNYAGVLLTGLMFLLSAVGLFVRTITSELYNMYECCAGVFISALFLLMAVLWLYEFTSYCLAFYREYKRGLACFQ